MRARFIASSSRSRRSLEPLRDVRGSIAGRGALDSPYLVSTIYYHDGIFDRFQGDSTVADPAGQVVAHIARLLTPQQLQVGSGRVRPSL